MVRALLLVLAAAFVGCAEHPAPAAAGAGSSSAATVTEAPHAPAPTSAPVPEPPASAALAPEDWGNAALQCEGREACLAAAARVPAAAPPDIAANVRAKANGASGRCLVEAMMAAWNDDASDRCDEDAKKAMSAADRRLILATPARAAASWRRADEAQHASERPRSEKPR